LALKVYAPLFRTANHYLAQLAVNHKFGTDHPLASVCLSLDFHADARNQGLTSREVLPFILSNSHSKDVVGDPMVHPWLEDLGSGDGASQGNLLSQATTLAMYG
jgi:hypothetical protein